jgi:hypothetical protein
MRSRRIALLAAIVLAVVAAAAVKFAVTSSRGGGPGPLNLQIDGAGMGMTSNRGQPFSLSVPWIIRNPSNDALVLDRIEAVGVRHGGIEILGAYATPLTHVPHRNYFPGYRVPPFGHALPGAVIEPHAQLALVFGLKATKLGRNTFKALHVLYRDGSTSYVATAELAVAVCTLATVKVCNDPLWAGGS